MHLATVATYTCIVSTLSLGTSPRTQAASPAQGVRCTLSGDGGATLTDAEVAGRLTGMATVRSADATTLETMLRDAREHEARFESAAAQALRREVVRAFDDEPRPSAALRALAATAMHDLAATTLADGNAVEARQLAQEALRRFADASLDTRQYPPPVQAVFSDAAAQLALAPRHELTVRLDSGVAGDLWVEGTSLGAFTSRRVLTLPAGRYRIWASHEGGTSLPYAVDLTRGPIEIRIDLSLEERVELLPRARLRCSACAADLVALAARLSAARCTLLDETQAREPTSTRAAASSEAEVSDPHEAPPPALTRDGLGFRVWWIVPFGIGQLSERRLFLGATFLTAELGLLAWNIVATLEHQRQSTAADPGAVGWRQQRNLSAALFWSSLVVGIGEAVVHGLVASPAAATPQS